MTEKEWLTAIDPQPMLEFLSAQEKPSERKFRLYFCGGCRFIWNLLYQNSSRKAVEVAERFADGKATEDELGAAKYSAEVPTFGYDFENPPGWPLTLSPEWAWVRRLVELGAFSEHELLKERPEADPVVRQRLMAAAELAYQTVRSNQCQYPSYLIDPAMRNVNWPSAWLVRCVFANPFHPPPTLAPYALLWNNGTVRRLAEAAYEMRSIPDGLLDSFCLSLVADALEESGCDSNEEIPKHLRSPGPHVRGCWALDLILGKS